MKKAVMLLMISALVAGSLFANGQQEAAADETIVLKVMGYGDNSNQEGISWKRIVETFEAENPNIDIQDELLYDEAYHQKVTARLASGDVPHVAYMGADARWGAPWKEAGQQYDMTKDIDTAQYDINLIPKMGPKGERYYIPMGTSNMTTVLYMNKNLVESMGFSQPRTYEDLVAMVPAAKAAGIEVVSIDGADGWAWGSCLMSALVARTTGDLNFVSKAVAGTKSFTDEGFVAALALIERMVKDGVISEKSVLVDYGTNTSNFNNEKALFMVQGQWAAGSIENPNVKDDMVLMAWPKMPGEKAAANNTVAAAWQVGYGVTKAGASDAAVLDAAVKFINFFNSEAEVEQRLRDGAIVAPILKGYVTPSDLPNAVTQKVLLAQNAVECEVIDAFLTGDPNDALNTGMQKIASGLATPAEVAAEVEALARK
ncbi:MAG: extracellular solute-binding protein [Spirochaetales bacterium]|nr:extracellular solute-binding protein [Spirochaetales bacterium]